MAKRFNCSDYIQSFQEVNWDCKKEFSKSAISELNKLIEQLELTEDEKAILESHNNKKKIRLSKQEKGLAELIIRGLSNTELAKTLNRKNDSIRVSVSRLYVKTGLNKAGSRKNRRKIFIKWYRSYKNARTINAARA